ncbi:MAG: thiamine pyrophosphate-binding protein [Leucobacter sp.]
MYYYEALARALKDEGITDIFGVLGDANLFFMNEWEKNGGSYVACAHEGTAVLAASGYSTTADRVGVATVTHGPALTNALTALTDAVRAGMPIVLLAGDTDPAQPNHLQYIDQVSVVAASGAIFEEATGPNNAAIDLARALARSARESTPVVLNIPITLQWQEVEYVPAAAHTPLEAFEANEEAVMEAAAAIANARRPIILGGRGARGAREQLIALAERIQAPVATTLRGKGLFQGYPHNLGIFGGLSHETAVNTIARADCVIVFGAGLNQITTENESLLRGKQVVHVDLNTARHRRKVSGAVEVVGEAASVAETLVELLDEIGHVATKFADDELASALVDPRSPLRASTPRGGLDVVAALRQIDKVFPQDRTLIIDDGRFILTAYAELGAPHPSAYVHACSFASIGLGIGNAIGAKAGAPDRPALVVVGDGGFMSAGLNELNTAVRHGLDMVVIVVNDRSYGAEHVQLVNRGMDPSISCFDWPNFGDVATALGARGTTVRSLQELDAALTSLAVGSGVVLIDLVVDPYDVPGSFV